MTPPAPGAGCRPAETGRPGSVGARRAAAATTAALAIAATLAVRAQAPAPDRPTPSARRPAPSSGVPCARLVDVSLASARVTSAAEEESGTVEGVAVQARCRVAIVATPTSDSRIGIEVWIPPAARWNGKLLGTGNGGFSGDLGYRAMADGLRRGYAVAGSDTGHTGDSMAFGTGHPEKIVDWAYRAVHEMTVAAKAVLRAHGGRGPSRSYFTGCSTGGQQALSEAQRYPDDYDGIVAGDPGNNRLRLVYAFLWTWLATHDEAGRSILPSAKLPALARAAVAACDAGDGLADGLISNLRACRFDPGQLACDGAETDGCLTAPQVEAARKVYEGPRNPRTRARIFSGWAPGSELGWRGYITDPGRPVRLELFTGWAFDNPAWNPRSFDFDRDVAAVDAKLGFLDATSTDLSRFRRRGGRLLMYTGLADPVVPPQDTIDYYESVSTAGGGMEAVRRFFRFFTVPGMGHCGGGTGPNRFDAIGALEAWVERGTAPDRMLATEEQDGRTVRSRPLCAYPLEARFIGSGSYDDAEGFRCLVPPIHDSGRVPLAEAAPAKNR